MNISTTARQAEISHYNIQPQLIENVYAATVDGRDLGGVSDEILKRVAAVKNELPRGSHIEVRGQVQTMRSSFRGLGYGLIGAIILAYLLIVVNFQSWLDPFIIITALPGALAGICWILLLTHTTLSVPSLTGAIMCMGVATANSILMVSFAREQMSEGKSAREAALQAGYRTRHARCFMTALAMIIGMVPMAHRSRRGRRTERAARPRRDWRTSLRYLRDAIFCSLCLLNDSRPARAEKAA